MIQKLRLLFHEWIEFNSGTLTLSQYSYDFQLRYSKILIQRLQLVSVFFAVMALLWTPIDFIAFDTQTAIELLIIRLLWAGSMLFISFSTFSNVNVVKCSTRKQAALFIVMGLFYLASWHVILEPSASHPIALGYSFMPFVMIAVIAAFPSSILQISFQVGLIFLLQLIDFYLSNHSFDFMTMGIEVWLLLLLASITGWGALSQFKLLTELHKEASSDYLTKVPNRAAFMNQAHALAETQPKHQTIAFLDLDYFKKINDTLGHYAGDCALIAFSDLLRDTLPKQTIMGRIGGEEFAIILPSNEQHIYETIRQKAEKMVVSDPDFEDFQLTVSIGVAPFLSSVKEAVNQADEALYQAKEQGRNQVCFKAD